MGDKRGIRKLAIACVAVLSGAALAAAVASAQGPGDYQPTSTSTTIGTSTTTTTTLPAPPPEAEAQLKIKTKNKQVLDGSIEVKAKCGSKGCAAKGTGKLTIRRPSEQKDDKRARRYNLKKAKAQIPAEGEETLHLKVPKLAMRQGRKAFSTDGDYVRANLRVFAIDTDGATATKKTKAKIVSP